MVLSPPFTFLPCCVFFFQNQFNLRAPPLYLSDAFPRHGPADTLVLGPLVHLSSSALGIIPFCQPFRPIFYGSIGGRLTFLVFFPRMLELSSTHGFVADAFLLPPPLLHGPLDCSFPLPVMLSFRFGDLLPLSTSRRPSRFQVFFSPCPECIGPRCPHAPARSVTIPHPTSLGFLNPQSILSFPPPCVLLPGRRISPRAPFPLVEPSVPRCPFLLFRSEGQYADLLSPDPTSP